MDKQKINKPVRPFCMEYAEAKEEIFTTINGAIQKHGIPLFLMKDIVSAVLAEVEKAANIECTKAKQMYESQLAEYEKANAKNE